MFRPYILAAFHTLHAQNPHNRQHRGSVCNRPARRPCMERPPQTCGRPHRQHRRLQLYRCGRRQVPRARAAHRERQARPPHPDDGLDELEHRTRQRIGKRYARDRRRLCRQGPARRRLPLARHRRRLALRSRTPCRRHSRSRQHTLPQRHEGRGRLSARQGFQVRHLLYRRRPHLRQQIRLVPLRRGRCSQICRVGRRLPQVRLLLRAQTRHRQRQRPRHRLLSLQAHERCSRTHRAPDSALYVRMGQHSALALGTQGRRPDVACHARPPRRLDGPHIRR